MVRIHRCHQGIIHVAEVVPNAVSFVYAHVAHLHRQKIFQCGLPNMAVVNVVVNFKRFGFVIAVNNLLNARLSYF